ncbi:MAG: hypothetical protein WBN40_10720, partial [Pseudomonadales bacterium]
HWCVHSAFPLGAILLRYLECKINRDKSMAFDFVSVKRCETFMRRCHTGFRKTRANFLFSYFY